MASSFVSDLFGSSARDVFFTFHGESISYTASGGSPATITAHVHREAIPEVAGEGRQAFRRATVKANVTDVAAADERDTFTFDGLDFKPDVARGITNREGPIVTVNVIAMLRHRSGGNPVNAET